MKAYGTHNMCGLAHPKTPNEVFGSMKKRVKTNPGHGYPHAAAPGIGMGGGRAPTIGRTMAPKRS